jgi:hypothetical protein
MDKKTDSKAEVTDQVEKAALKVLTTVIGVGIIGLFSILYNFNARLARIETQLQYLNPQLAHSADK